MIEIYLNRVTELKKYKQLFKLEENVWNQYNIEDIIAPLNFLNSIRDEVITKIKNLLKQNIALKINTMFYSNFINSLHI